MRIAGTEINLAFKAFEIYISGCKAPHCQGCHNPELWDFSVGSFYDPSISEALKTKALEMHEAGLADYAWILGGEPLDQDLNELMDLIDHLKSVDLKIVLWTHYNEVPERILSMIDYIKTGPYIEGQESYVEPLFGVKLANPEQKLYAVKDFINVHS